MIAIAGCSKSKDPEPAAADAAKGDPNPFKSAKINFDWRRLSVGNGSPEFPEEGALGRRQVKLALGLIPTIMGENALKRIKACGFSIQWSSSWVVPRDDHGESTIQVFIDLKDAAQGDASLYREINLSWRIRDGVLTPRTRWADQIQNEAPIDDPVIRQYC